jgi:bifunctional DNA-binding transcriptional regulator/antitoxin component of YhaV-PrlF toxin-antitoxin module
MSRISSKNQITVPVRVLREAGLRPGDEIEVRANGIGELKVRMAEDLIARFAGAMPPGTYPPGAARELRRQWRALS